MRRSWKCGCASIRIGGAAFSDLVLVKLGIVAAFIPLMIMYTRKNWPRRFDPAAIPREAMPGR
jgi:hypothetical protein